MELNANNLAGNFEVCISQHVEVISRNSTEPFVTFIATLKTIEITNNNIKGELAELLKIFLCNHDETKRKMKNNKHYSKYFLSFCIETKKKYI